jgi:hypothetical protein
VSNAPAPTVPKHNRHDLQRSKPAAHSPTPRPASPRLASEGLPTGKHLIVCGPDDGRCSGVDYRKFFSESVSLGRPVAAFVMYARPGFFTFMLGFSFSSDLGVR